MNSPRVHLAGDPDHGFSNTHDLRGAAHARVELEYTGRFAHPYARLVIDCEVYKAPDGMLSVHSICPKCGKAIMIRGDQKRIELDEERGLLFVSEFGCPWELEGDRRMQFGIGMCKFRCEYAGKVVREA
jgi:predicted RNA-binding Zn-ribbon protein involved in translation (DUF1610 family)